MTHLPEIDVFDQLAVVQEFQPEITELPIYQTFLTAYEP